MKFRIDFVTNSSSSSFCTVTVQLKNGNKVSFRGANEYDPFASYREVDVTMKEIDTIEKLHAFLVECGGIWPYAQSAISSITSLDEVESMNIEHRYECSDGDGDYEGTIDFNFMTKEYRTYQVNLETDDDEAYYELGDEGIFPEEYLEEQPENFSVSYENPVIEELVEEFNYVCQDYKIFDIYTEEEFFYYGAEDLDSLTKTILSFLVTFGEAEEGFINALVENEEKIRQHFTKIEGYFTTCVDESCFEFEGADFELKDNELVCDYRTCYGGW